MKPALKIFILAITVGCSTMGQLQNRYVTFNPGGSIVHGAGSSAVYEKLGTPALTYQDGNKNYLIYERGFVEIQNDRVAQVLAYNPEYVYGTSFKNYVSPGNSVSKTLLKLGKPQEISSLNDGYYFRYNNGAVFFKDEQIVQVQDKVFQDGHQFTINISSFSDSSSDPEASYYVASGSKEFSQNDFQFKEVKRYIERAIRDQGRKISSTKEKAQYIVLVNFGISDPKENIDVVSRPVYLPSFNPGSTTNVYGSFGNKLGSLQTDSSWSLQYAGQQTETIRTTVYTRWLNVTAFSKDIWQKTQEIHPVWKVLTTSEGSSGDLRLLIPALSLGVQNYIDVDTGTQVIKTAMSDVLNDYYYETKFLNTNLREVASKSKK